MTADPYKPEADSAAPAGSYDGAILILVSLVFWIGGVFCPPVGLFALLFSFMAYKWGVRDGFVRVASVTLMIIGISVISMFWYFLYQKNLGPINDMLTASDLRQLSLAVHQYDADHGQLAPGSHPDKDGHPLLSWRVALLPYLDHEELYKRFRLDEPWDSPHNAGLIGEMPKVYRSRRVSSEPGQTPYQVFVGPGTPFDPTRSVTFGDIARQDGGEHTFLIVEAAVPVIWTSPNDLPYSPDLPLPATHKGYRGFKAVFADGSVRGVRNELPEVSLRAFITWNGSEKVSQADLD